MTLLTITVRSSGTRSTSYALSSLHSEGRRGWRLTKIGDYKLRPGELDEYDVWTGPVECSCMGWTDRGTCKHVAGLKEHGLI